MNTKLPEQRIIGRIAAQAPGPTLITVGSIHGNEPAGARALVRVVERLRGDVRLERGDVVALTGNLAALRAGRRFIDEDLNRRFDGRALGEGRAEDFEQRELLAAIDEARESARGPVVLIDLHTTSGEGAPFGVFADTMASRNFARAFPVPIVLGLEEQLAGTLIDFMGLSGAVAVGFEGGQHDDPRSVNHLAAIVWIALSNLGLVAEGVSDGVDDARRRLASSVEEAPRILEVAYRHAVENDDAFRMLPGFRSFQPVMEHDVIATDKRGDVAAPASGFLLMPLYQKQGNDGFFVVRRVHTFWLWLSALLRYARAGRVAHFLPGVTRVAGEAYRVHVNRRVARWYSLEFLHLLGFRRRSESSEALLMERRAHDLP